jgi:hypothetical protein
MNTKGSFVSLDNYTLTLSGDGGETRHDVMPTATVTLNGKTAQLEDLLIGDRVSLQGDPAVVVSATR